MVKIEKVVAREVLDSRGFPTVEVELFSGDMRASAIVPSGASTGEGEALELRDGDPSRFAGKGVLKAVQNVEREIAPAINGKEFLRQSVFDDLLRNLDGTPNKAKLGANAILPVSMAFARLQSMIHSKQGFSALALTENISGVFGSQGMTLPVPLMNVFNGGKHADNGIAIQEFMIVPTGFNRFSDSLRAGVEIFHSLKKILTKKGLTTAVGDEGGFAPRISSEDEAGPGSHEKVLTLLLDAIETAGYRAGEDVFLALDCASSEFSKKTGAGVSYQFEGSSRSSAEMTQIYEKWISQYPILSIEDGLAEHDWEGWRILTQRIGKQVQLVGDDLFVTNPEFLKKGIERGVANSILVKLNQIGTLTETLEAMKMAHLSGYTTIISHRSGESEDCFIADLAVATDAGQIKTGSASRSDRLAKYNQLLRLEQALGSRARFKGKGSFPAR
ncbi:MAG: phosphopyruvate hydratase [Bdellovibrionales bacterium]|nr:phosphopyruvate hydratase [Bdellovibrionales bacterium]